MWVVVWALLGRAALAGPVGVDMARAGALGFLRQHELLHRGVPKLVYQVDSTFFVFGFDKGFVIISADDRVAPVAGYSLESRFVAPGIGDTVTAANFLSWIRYRKDQMACLRKGDIPASPDVSEQWNNLLEGIPARNAAYVVPPLLTSVWGQLWPYNSLCPPDPNGSGGHVAAGCGPLAMAQILRYHQYPLQGLGSYGYTQSPYPTTSANFGITTYDWVNMPDSIAVIDSAVTTLIYHAGVSVKAEWSPGGTTSGASTIMMALVNYFKMAYAPMRYVSRSSFSNAGWDTLLQHELHTGRPVYYQGFGTNGHAFVCDGVDADDLYHFNWGWNGLYNGYFALNDLTPGPYNFTYGQGAIIGIQPNDGSTVAENTTWSDSVTLLTNVAVPYAVTLTLNPGSVIRFAQGCRLRMWGRMLSIANQANPTTLTAIVPEEGWEGIDWYDEFDRMAEVDSSRLVHTTLEYSRSSAIDCNAFGKVMIDQCSIRNNFGDAGYQYPGIRMQLKPASIRNSEIYNNGAGGISILNTGTVPAVISKNYIHDNCGRNGGGILLNNSRITLSENRIHHNVVSQSGGGVYFTGGLPLLVNNRITNNHAGWSGGGVFLENSNPVIISNLIANNSAGDSLTGSGGGIQCSLNASPGIFLNTVTNNCALYGGGISLSQDCCPVIKSTILFGNEALTGSQVCIDDGSADPVFNHCDIQGGLTGFGGGGSGGEYDPELYTDNLDVMPQFIAPTSGAGTGYDGSVAGWRLQSFSPCVDAGDTVGMGNAIPSFDPDGNVRVQGTADIGAFEYPLGVPDNLIVLTDTITYGENYCYDATQTITLGGSGKQWIISPGGGATLTAGLKISMSAVTRVQSGGYLLARVSLSGPWCQEPTMPALRNLSEEIDNTESSTSPGGHIRIYPNPTRGLITVDLSAVNPGFVDRIQCFTLPGVSLLDKEVGQEQQYQIDMTGFSPGVYLILIHAENGWKRGTIVKW